jgi:hypothetical protein
MPPEKLAVTERGPSRNFWIVVSLLSLGAALAPFLIPAILVCNDLYKHLMVAKVIADYADPLLKYSAWYQIHLRPVPTIFGDLLLAGLVKVADPLIAAKLYYVAFAAGLWFAGIFYVKRAGLPWFGAILLLPLMHTTLVFLGLLPFIATIALYPLLLGVLIEKNGSRAQTGLSVGVILLVLYGFHPMGAAVGALTVMFYAANTKTKRRRRHLLAAIVPTALIMLYNESGNSRHGALLRFRNVPGQVREFFAFNIWTLARPAGWLFMALIVVFVALAIRQAWQRTAAHPRLLLLAALLVAIGLVLPYQIGGEVTVGARTFPYAVIAAVGGLTWNSKLLRQSIAVVCVFLAASSILNTQRSLALQPLYREFLSGMPIVKPGSKILPIIADLQLGGNQYIQPFVGVEDIYNIYRGGTNPYVFAAPFLTNGATLLSSSHPFTYTSKFAAPVTDYRGVSRDYDYIVCWGRPEAEAAVASDARPVFQNGPLTIYAGSR